MTTWPDGKVPYIIDRDKITGDNLAALEQRIIELNQIFTDNGVQVSLVPRNKEKGYLHITEVMIYDSKRKSQYCGSSMIGFTNEEQRLDINRRCYDNRTIIHEFFHALGVHHEHNHPDRDLYIDVDSDSGQYNKIDTVAFQLDYDINSIMHYKSGFKILEDAPFTMAITGNDEVTNLDIEGIKELYNNPEHRDLMHPNGNPDETFSDSNMIYQSTLGGGYGDISDEMVTLFWYPARAEDGIRTYRIYKDEQLIAEQNNTVYIDEDLSAETKLIKYEIRAVSNSGIVRAIEYIRVEGPRSKPNPVENLQIVERNISGVTLTWEPRPDDEEVTGYICMAASAGGFYTFDTTTNSCTISAPSSSRYAFYVRAKNKVGDSDSTEVVSDAIPTEVGQQYSRVKVSDSVLLLPSMGGIVCRVLPEDQNNVEDNAHAWRQLSTTSSFQGGLKDCDFSETPPTTTTPPPSSGPETGTPPPTTLGPGTGQPFETGLAKDRYYTYDSTFSKKVLYLQSNGIACDPQDSSKYSQVIKESAPYNAIEKMFKASGEQECEGR